MPRCGSLVPCRDKMGRAPCSVALPEPKRRPLLAGCPLFSLPSPAVGATGPGPRHCPFPLPFPLPLGVTGLLPEYDRRNALELDGCCAFIHVGRSFGRLNVGLGVRTSFASSSLVRSRALVLSTRGSSRKLCLPARRRRLRCCRSSHANLQNAAPSTMDFLSPLSQ